MLPSNSLVPSVILTISVDFPEPQYCSPARALHSPLLKLDSYVPTSSAFSSNTPIQSLLPSFPPTSHSTSSPLNCHKSNLNNTNNTNLDDNPMSTSSNVTNNPLVHNTVSYPRLSGAPPSNSTLPSESQSPTASKAASSENHEVTFVAVPSSSSKCILTANELSIIERHLPRKLKHVLKRLASGQSFNSKFLFTWADLKNIVSSALQEHKGNHQFNYTQLLHSGWHSSSENLLG